MSFISAGLTVGEHARGRQLDVGKSSQVVEHGAAVAVLLGVVHKGPDVVLLAVVADAGADHHGDVVCSDRRGIQRGVAATCMHGGPSRGQGSIKCKKLHFRNVFLFIPNVRP